MDEEQPPSPAQRVISVFQKVSSADRELEQARLAKRSKRGIGKETATAPSSGAATPVGAPAPMIAPPEPEKRLSKKDRKAAETKMSDVQQQKSANETARMAMGLGAANLSKKYSWLNKVSAASHAASLGQTSTKSNATLNSVGSTPGSNRTGPPISRLKRFGDWDENEDFAIQARDILSVLESDGKAARALSRGYNTPEKLEKR